MLLIFSSGGAPLLVLDLSLLSNCYMNYKIIYINSRADKKNMYLHGGNTQLSSVTYLWIFNCTDIHPWFLRTRRNYTSSYVLCKISSRGVNMRGRMGLSLDWERTRYLCAPTTVEEERINGKKFVFLFCLNHGNIGIDSSQIIKNG